MMAVRGAWVAAATMPAMPTRANASGITSSPSTWFAPAARPPPKVAPMNRLGVNTPPQRAAATVALVARSFAKASAIRKYQSRSLMMPMFNVSCPWPHRSARNTMFSAETAMPAMTIWPHRESVRCTRSVVR